VEVDCQEKSLNLHRSTKSSVQLQTSSVSVSIILFNFDNEFHVSKAISHTATRQGRNAVSHSTCNNITAAIWKSNVKTNVCMDKTAVFWCNV